MVGLAIFVGMVLAAIFAGLIVLGIVAAVVVIGLIVLAVDRLLLAISPKRRERRANLTRSFVVWRTDQPTGSGPVIDTTARLNESGREPRSEESGD